MTDARGHNIKMMKKERKRKMIRRERKYPIRLFVCFELKISFLMYLMFI